MAALLLPYLDIFDMSGDGRNRSDLPAIDPRLISSDPLAEDPSLPPLDTLTPDPVPEAVPPTGGTPSEDPPTGDGTTPGPEVVPTNAPDTPPSGSGESRFVTFSLDVRPQRARVFINGQAQDDPSNVRLPYSNEPVQVTVSAPRHQRASFTMTPDMDRARRVVLRRRARPTKGEGQTDRPGGDLVSNPYSPR